MITAPGAAAIAYLNACRERAGQPPRLVVEGRLNRVVGLTLEAVGVQAAIGSRCRVLGTDATELETEVVGFAGDRLFLMPIGDLQGIAPNAAVVPTGHCAQAPVGECLLGRVIDGAGRPLDGKGPLRNRAWAPLNGRPINPLARAPIREPLDVGVRAINGLLTVGRGQRMGLFAGSGVGKSVLLGMMTRYTAAEVVVVGLIGERGREVKEFIDTILGEAGLARAVVVAAPADSTPLMRLQGALLCTAIAEHFRDQGRQVLLLMDSLTRYAQAQRELALAIGEPPATKGYPPSVFAKLPHLVERAGNGERGGGSITAFYTVLAEGDDQQDPVADAARSHLDGHFVLSRALADSGHYPAIDIEQSISRVMNNVVPAAHVAQARRLKSLWSHYQRSRDLVAVGAYVAGSDPETDLAIALLPQISRFLRQDVAERCDLEASRQALARLAASSGAGSAHHAAHGAAHP